MQCLHTRIARHGTVIDHGHMPWTDANEALRWARVMYQTPPHTGPLSFSFEIALCDSEWCVIQQAIDAGVTYAPLQYLPPLE